MRLLQDWYTDILTRHCFLVSIRPYALNRPCAKELAQTTSGVSVPYLLHLLHPVPRCWSRHRTPDEESIQTWTQEME